MGLIYQRVEWLLSKLLIAALYFGVRLGLVGLICGVVYEIMISDGAEWNTIVDAGQKGGAIGAVLGTLYGAFTVLHNYRWRF